MTRGRRRGTVDVLERNVEPCSARRPPCGPPFVRGDRRVRNPPPCEGGGQGEVANAGGRSRHPDPSFGSKRTTARRGGSVAVLLRLLCGVLPIAMVASAAAQSPDELVRRAREAAALASGADGTSKAIDELGKVTVAFIQDADEATLRGGSGSAELRAAFDAIHTPLERLYRRSADAMEAGEREVIEADGDLEALYESDAYQRSFRVSANALYYLNWLRYYGARLKTGNERKRLLEQARDGFAEFTAGDPKSDLVVESRLGRGLCALELGNPRNAIEDLAAVADNPVASAERRHKARLSLLEARVRIKDVKAALRVSDELLKDAPPAEANWIRFMRLRALLDAIEKGGADTPRYRSEAVVLMDRLRRSGGDWAKQVAALAQEAFDDPEAWKANATTPFAKWELAKLYVQKEDYAGATPLLEEVLKTEDPGLAKEKARARYFLGLAKFRAGDYAAAAQLLSESAELPDESERADRAYLLFKAREAQAAAAGADADLAGLEAAAKAFVEAYPKHPAAFEAWYRLAELRQLRGEYAEAIELYEKVQGDAAFELQAAFATAQARFELYKSAESAEARAAALTAVGDALDAFEQRLAKVEATKAELPLEAMQAKAAVMRAVARKLQPETDYRGIVAALAGFAEKFPGQSELFPQVARLRLEAMRELGDFAGAKEQIDKYGDLLLEDLGAGAMEDAAVAFIREGARRSGEGDKSASAAAQQVAMAIYERLAQRDEAGDRTRLTLARLRENAGDLDAAETLYTEVLAGETVSTTALRGLARIAEERGNLDEAKQQWVRLGEAVRPGDLPWYESHYERARLDDKQGRGAAACELLEGLRPAMPGLTDQDLRSKLSELYDRVCD